MIIIKGHAIITRRQLLHTAILILGCGERIKMINPDLRDFFRKKGIAIEALDTVRTALYVSLSFSLTTTSLCMLLF